MGRCVSGDPGARHVLVDCAQHERSTDLAAPVDDDGIMAERLISRAQTFLTPTVRVAHSVLGANVTGWPHHRPVGMLQESLTCQPVVTSVTQLLRDRQGFGLPHGGEYGLSPGAAIHELGADELQFPGRSSRRGVLRVPDGVTVAHGPLEARVQVRILVGQPARNGGDDREDFLW